MTIIFRYKSVKRPDGTQVKTPSIPILLKGEETIQVIALLDSGADISAIPKSTAEVLGLDLSWKRTFAFGIGGKVDSIETEVNITLEKGHEKYSFAIPIKVILDDYDLPILLDRNGFFNRFIISFDQNSEKVTLKWIGNSRRMAR